MWKVGEGAMRAFNHTRSPRRLQRGRRVSVVPRGRPRRGRTDRLGARVARCPRTCRSCACSRSSLRGVDEYTDDASAPVSVRSKVRTVGGWQTYLFSVRGSRCPGYGTRRTRPLSMGLPCATALSVFICRHQSSAFYRLHAAMGHVPSSFSAMHGGV